MAINSNPDAEQILQVLIESDGIYGVLSALANVCEARSVHLAEKCLDTTGAKEWAERADAIEMLMEDE